MNTETRTSVAALAEMIKHFERRGGEGQGFNHDFSRKVAKALTEYADLVGAKTYDPAAVDQMREDIHRLCVEVGIATDVVRQLVEIMDSGEDGGDGVFEERLERLLPEARALVQRTALSAK